MDTRRLILVSEQDEVVAELDDLDCTLSGVLARKLQEGGDLDTVPFYSGLPTSSLVLVAGYLQKHRSTLPMKIDRPLRSIDPIHFAPSKWDAKFICAAGTSRPELYNLIRVA